MLAALPDPIEAYIRPLPGRTNFALFPWAGVRAGRRDRRRADVAPRSTESQERRLQAGLLLAGLAGHRGRLRGVVPAVDLSGRELLDQLADVLLHPPRHLHGDGADRARHRSLSRVRAPAAGQLLLGARCARPRHHDARPLVAVRLLDSRRDGLRRPRAVRSKRALPLEASLVATVALCALLYAIVKWKDRKMQDVELTGAWRIFAPGAEVAGERSTGQNANR